VWVLLQPRDFLTSSLLYVGVSGMLLAVVVGMSLGATETLQVSLPAYKGSFGDPDLATAPLSPDLFVTIACGSTSGFHSLVSSGTTAKQLDQESDARAIGYGGMLAEDLLATVVLMTVAVYAEVPAGSGIELALPNFGTGGGIILNAAFGVGEGIAAASMGLVLVSFLATSTDTAVRLGSDVLEEIVGTPETRTQEYAANRYVNSAVQVLPAYLLVASGSWANLWPLFGGANQTLAVLALLTATLWLANKDERKQLVSTGGPMVAMLSVTILALLYLALYQNVYRKFLLGNWGDGSILISAVAGALQTAIALVLVWLAARIVALGYENVREAPQDVAVADGGEASEEREKREDRRE
jgi:carbon starvation protein